MLHLNAICTHLECALLHNMSTTAKHIPVSQSSTIDSNPDSEFGFKILKEELRYSRYLNVYNRVVQYPPSKEEVADSSKCERKIVEYDIVGAKTRSFHFCAVFPYDTLTKSVTIIKEYAQGGNCYMYGVPCGVLSEKHQSSEDCVRMELSEEAQLQGGNLVKLIPDDHPGLLERDAKPHPMDPEEVIEILTVDIPSLKEIMYGGYMMLPSVVTCTMALKYLQDQGLLTGS